MGLFSLFFQYLLEFTPYCSSKGKPNIPANLYKNREMYDGVICPGNYFVTIPGK